MTKKKIDPTRTKVESIRPGLGDPVQYELIRVHNLIRKDLALAKKWRRLDKTVKKKGKL